MRRRATVGAVLVMLVGVGCFPAPTNAPDDGAVHPTAALDLYAPEFEPDAGGPQSDAGAEVGCRPPDETCVSGERCCDGLACTSADGQGLCDGGEDCRCRAPTCRSGGEACERHDQCCKGWLCVTPGIYAECLGRAPDCLCLDRVIIP